MKRLLIRNGRIIDPVRGHDRPGSLLVAGGKIVPGDDFLPGPEDTVIDAAGLVVCPGFIDLHCHLRQPGFEAKETIATGTRAAARGGFTTVCGMPNTSPPLDSPEIIERVKAIAAAEGAVRVLPIGCVSRNRAGKEPADMAALARAGAVAFSDDGSPVADDGLMRRALVSSRTLGRPVIDHCEDMRLSRDGQVNEGATARQLGLRGIPAAAEENMVRRDLALAVEVPDCQLHIAHVSTADAAALIKEAKARGVPVTAEVTPHHLTLTEAAVLAAGTMAKVNPPLRTERDTAALLAALREGVIDAIATDHAPHTTADKPEDFTRAAFGISGLETALGSLMGLVHEGKLDLMTLIAKLTAGPAKILHRKDLGTLAAGAAADITIFDPEMEWTVDVSRFASQGKNTPLAGKKLRGRVLATIYGGEIIYLDESLKSTKILAGKK
ncbi:MAG: dihydroorotase [Chloroflexota bacterium]